MTSRNLSTVTTDLIASYGNTVTNMIQVYRAGGERVVVFMDQRWENALKKSAAKLTVQVRSDASTAQRVFSAYSSKGIDLTSSGAKVVVDKVIELAGKGLQQVAANASLFEKSTGVTALQTIATAAVPAAEAVNRLAGRIEHQSGVLANRFTKKKSKLSATAVKRVTPIRTARPRKAA